MVPTSNVSQRRSSRSRLQAITESSIQCKTMKRGRACASTKATASTFAKATAEAYADAFAQALDHCDCAVSGTVPAAVGSTDYFREFVVSAASKVDTTICIEGTPAKSRPADPLPSSPPPAEFLPPDSPRLLCWRGLWRAMRTAWACVGRTVLQTDVKG